MRLSTLLFCTLFAAPLWAQSDALPDAATVSQPEGWNDDLALTIPEDLNPDPNILEINLEAVIREMEIVPGKKTPVWTYNGSLPGPLIRAKVGDRVIVHFKNSLPEDTSIHWHGLRISNDQDGVPGFTMEPVHPQGEFTYDFVLPDAGTFWYHPHVDDSAAQLGYGLYGPLIVDDPNEPKGLGDELLLVLSDMSLDENGQFLPADVGGGFGNLFGREGEVLLVNGKVMPTLKVRQGKPQRWRVLNAARSRYYTLRYNRSPLVKLGGDGGLAARSETLDEIKIVPSERLDLVFTPPDKPGTVDYLRWYPTDRGYGTTYYRVAEDMMKIETVDEPPVKAAPAPQVLNQEIMPLDITGANEREINLTIDYDGDKNVVMGINGIPHQHAVPIMVTAGDTEIWTIRNDTDFSHPFHLHGFFFQVLGDDQILQWKDTVDVPTKTSLRLAVHFDDRPGMWMYHCHILDHAEAGMMGHLHVMPKP
jgi:FtsP/CotA-like multicopper oxidase with cupredoxin domain